MRILFTGASSFTGYWFVRRLAEAGHQVVATVRTPIERRSPLRRKRLDLLLPYAQLLPGISFGDPAFLELASEGWDLLCHHAAETTDYRSPQFDPHQATLNNSRALPEVVEALKGGGCHHLLLTGSLFEPREGVGSDPDLPISPYGLSKGLTSDLFRYYSARAGLTLGKFVIPNPFGPFEEARFTDYLLRNWMGGGVPTVKSPDYIRDNIHVSLLAHAYLAFAEKLAQSTGFLRSNPSGYRESQGAFAQRVAREVEERTSLPCPLQLAKQSQFDEPLIRVNSEPVDGRLFGWEERAAWDEFIRSYIHGGAS